MAAAAAAVDAAEEAVAAVGSGETKCGDGGVGSAAAWTRPCVSNYH